MLNRLRSIHFFVMLFLGILFIQGCIQPTTKVFVKAKAAKNTSFSISSVRIQNNQLVLIGNNLQDVAQIKLKRSGFDEDFTPESVSATQVIANGTRLITVGVGQVFDLILSNASGAATFQVDFTLSNHSVALNKLSVTGATAGQVIKFNGTDWVPASLTEAQIYLGTWNASNNIGGVPDLSSVSSTPGEYYIASHAGTLNGVSYAIGDWIISDGYQWQKIAASKTSVTSFQGRQGIVTLTPADYVSLINTGTNKITGSSINDLFDVNISAPSNGSVLKYNGSKWVVGTDNTGIAAGSIVNADISASAAIDQSKIANLTTDLAALQSTTGLAAAVRSVTLTGLSSSTGTVSASDTILGAFGKMVGTQGDYVSRTNAGSVTMNGSLNFTGVASSISVPTSLILAQTDVTNVEYVTNAIAANGLWTKGASSSINYTAGNIGIGTTTPGAKLTVSGSSGSLINTIGYGTNALTAYYDDGTTIGARIAGSGRVFARDYTDGQATGTQTVSVGQDGAGGIGLKSNSLIQWANASWWDTKDVGLARNSAGVLEVNNGTAGTYRDLQVRSMNVDGYLQSPAGTNRMWFDLAGATRLQGADGTLFVEKGTGSMSYIGTPGNYPLNLGANGATNLSILANGNIGVGTASPDYNLDVVGSMATSNGLIASKLANSASNHGFDFYNHSGNTGWPVNNSTLASWSWDVNNSKVEIMKLWAVDATTYRLSGMFSIAPFGIQSNAGFGGDVSVYGATLVFNHAGNPYIDLSKSETLHPFKFRTSIADSGSALGYQFDTLNSLSTSGAKLVSFKNSGVERASIDKDGVLEAGQVNSMNGTFRSTGSTIVLHPTYDNSRWIFSAGDSSLFLNTAGGTPVVKLGSSDASSQLALYASNSERIRIDSSGKVGIGTTLPSTLLHVSTSSAGATVATFESGTGSCTIIPNSGVSCSSDVRLKQNIHEIINGLDKVLNLRGVSFEWKDRGASPPLRHIGFIAQEVEKVAPELVQKDKRGYKQVNYANFVAILTEAIKDLYHNHIKNIYHTLSGNNERMVALEEENRRILRENANIKKALCEMGKQSFCK